VLDDPLTKEQITGLFHIIDQDGSGQVNYAEWLQSFKVRDRKQHKKVQGSSSVGLPSFRSSGRLTSSTGSLRLSPEAIDLVRKKCSSTKKHGLHPQLRSHRRRHND
jgi:hypothetical protein